MDEDALARLGVTPCTKEGRWVRVKTLSLPSNEPMHIFEINDKKDLRHPILEYISQGIVPSNEIKEKHIRLKAAWYTILNGKRNRKSIDGGPLKTCVSLEEGKSILARTHVGPGGDHQGGRTLALQVALLANLEERSKRNNPQMQRVPGAPKHTEKAISCNKICLYASFVNLQNGESILSDPSHSLKEKGSI